MQHRGGSEKLKPAASSRRPARMPHRLRARSHAPPNHSTRARSLQHERASSGTRSHGARAPPSVLIRMMVPSGARQSIFLARYGALHRMCHHGRCMQQGLACGSENNHNSVQAHKQCDCLCAVRWQAVLQAAAVGCAPYAVQNDVHSQRLGRRLDTLRPVLCLVVERPCRPVVEALLHLLVAARPERGLAGHAHACLARQGTCVKSQAALDLRRGQLCLAYPHASSHMQRARIKLLPI